MAVTIEKDANLPLSLFSEAPRTVTVLLNSSGSMTFESKTAKSQFGYPEKFYLFINCALFS